MKTGRGNILMLLIVIAILLTSGPSALAQGPAPPNTLPELLEFDRKYCPVCRASELVILSVKNRYPGQFVVRKLYIDEDENLFRRYRVVFVPTQVFIDPAGNELYRHEGVFKEEELIRKLRELRFISD
jgi:thiol-disulfide isomerase/thioredoxin